MAPEVRVSGPENEPMGILSLAEALRLAGEMDVDLVEIAATASPPPRVAMAGARSAETINGIPRAASFGATKPRPPRSSARVKRRVVSSSRSSSLSAASSRIGAT